MTDERPPILMFRRGTFLMPVSPADCAYVQDYPAGKQLRVRITQPRNVKANRLYWAMLQLVRDNLDNPPSIESLHAAVKMRLGYTVPIKTRLGIIEVPGSIAFDKMDEATFRDFLERFKDFIRAEVIPGLHSDAFEREALEMLGETAKETA